MESKVKGIEESISSFENVSYSNLRRCFSSTLYNALKLIKDKSDAAMQGVYAHRHGNTLGGAAIDISRESDTGRVKIARLKNDAKYPMSNKTDYRTKWFENGTVARYKKHGGAYTGAMTARHFFQNAIDTEKGKVEEYIQQEIDTNVRKLFNNK